VHGILDVIVVTDVHYAQIFNTITQTTQLNKIYTNLFHTLLKLPVNILTAHKIHIIFAFAQTNP